MVRWRMVRRTSVRLGTAMTAAILLLFHASVTAQTQGTDARPSGLVLVAGPKVALKSPTTGRFLGGQLDPMSSTLMMCSFSVRNVTSKPLTISMVTASCGCTSLQLGSGAPGRYALAAGQDVVVRANVDFSHLRPGPLNKF